MAEPEDTSRVGRAPRGVVRSRMVEGAVRLLATKGVEGTSFAEVLEATDSPRGSVYHHFPGGKPELLHAALDLASERGLAAMEATRGQPGTVVIERFLALWRGLLDYSRLTAGCAVVAVDRRSRRRRSPRSRWHDLSNLDGAARWPLSSRRRRQQVSPLARRDRHRRHRGSRGSVSSGAERGTLRRRSQRPDVPCRERHRPVSLDRTYGNGHFDPWVINRNEA